MTKYHTFWRRFLAGLVDALVFIPVMIVDAIIDLPARGTIPFLLWTTVSMLSYVVYSVTLHWRYGQTVGKRLCDVKVLNVSEDRTLTLSQALWRDVGYIAMQLVGLVHIYVLVLSNRFTPEAAYGQGIGLVVMFAGVAWVFLELATMLTNRKRRSLHDFIAKSVVVRVA